MKQSKSTIAAVAVGTLLIVASGVVHGMWTGRWNSIDVSSVVAKLQAVPKKIGDWEAVSDGTISQDSKDLAELEGYVMQHYRNRRTGESVGMLLMCGKTGPVAVHPPTACYAGQGYEQVGEVVTTLVEVPEVSPASATDKQKSPKTNLHAFNRAQFHKPSFAQLNQPRIYWAWTANGDWQVPDRPRMAFAGQPILFKLYVTTDTQTPIAEDESTTEERFLREFIPAVTEQFFAQNNR
jgi:hypothetical protein